MIQTLLVVFAVGFLFGGVAGIVAGRRWARAAWRRPAADVSPEPLPEGGYLAEVNFEAIAGTLVARCTERVQLPCALVMRDREGAPPYVAAVCEELDKRIVDMDVPMTGTVGRCILEGMPIVGPPNEPVMETARRDRRRPVFGGLAVPVGQGAHTMGAVVALGVPPGGSGDAVHGLAATVRQFVTQLVPAHQVWAAQKRAETDELTGLPNRRHLKNVMARGTGEQAALILLDIDHFKRINDTLGHPAGDAALVHLAKLLRETLRGADVAARLGGEEFAVWLAGGGPATAMEVAERLRERIERSPFRWQGNAHPFTISCGVACYPEPIRAAENLMVAADAGLYRAKRAGRNRVIAAGAEDKSAKPA